MTTPPVTTPAAPKLVDQNTYQSYQDTLRANDDARYKAQGAAEGFRDTDPLGNYLFAVNLSGWASGWFTSIGGIAAEFDVIEHKLTSITGEPYLIQIPGRPKWSTRLTLKHGVLNANEDLWTWMQYVQRGQMLRARTHCAIYLYTKAGQVAATWDVLNAWPSKISGPDFDAAGTTVAIETLELVHNGMWRTS